MVYLIDRSAGEKRLDVVRCDLHKSCSRFLRRPSHVRGNITVLRREIRVVRLHRLRVEHVDAGTAQSVFIQRRGERRLFDNAAARGIDQNGGGLHKGKRARVCRALGFLCERTVKGEIVGAGKQRIRVREFHAVTCGGTVRDGEHVHAECRCNLGDRPPYGAEAEDAERFAGKLIGRIGEIGKRLGARPVAAGDRCRIIVRTGGEMQDQRKYMLHDRACGIAGHITDDDSARICGFDVDVVDACGKHADIAQRRAGVHERGSDVRFVADDELAVPDGGRELFTGQCVEKAHLSERFERGEGNVSGRDGAFVKYGDFHGGLPFIRRIFRLFYYYSMSSAQRKALR